MPDHFCYCIHKWYCVMRLHKKIARWLYLSQKKMTCKTHSSIFLAIIWYQRDNLVMMGPHWLLLHHAANNGCIKVFAWLLHCLPSAVLGNAVHNPRLVVFKHTIRETISSEIWKKIAECNPYKELENVHMQYFQVVFQKDTNTYPT